MKVQFKLTPELTPEFLWFGSRLLPQPKASLIFGPWSDTEFYAQGGFSYHSNDGRGATQRVEPISADNHPRRWNPRVNSKSSTGVICDGGDHDGHDVCLQRKAVAPLDSEVLQKQINEEMGDLNPDGEGFDEHRR